MGKMPVFLGAKSEPVASMANAFFLDSMAPAPQAEAAKTRLKKLLLPIPPFIKSPFCFDLRELSPGPALILFLTAFYAPESPDARLAPGGHRARALLPVRNFRVMSAF
jgi:hypothetical protein